MGVIYPPMTIVNLYFITSGIFHTKLLGSVTYYSHNLKMVERRKYATEEV